MKLSRLIVLILLIVDIILFFMLQSEFDENGRWAIVGVALLLAIAWVYLEEPPQPKKQVRRVQPVKATQQETEEEDEIDIPPAVTEDSMDGATLRERKLAKVLAANQSEDEEVVSIEPDDDLEEVQVTVEEVHVASEYVVESSPQSIEDANIAAHIQDKRERHDRVRARIEERRREQMAEIRASTAKMWEAHSSGEDLLTIVQDPQNTHTILEEPAVAKEGHVYGASLVRIDENTILKLRIPVDTGYVQVESEEETETMPILPPGVPSPDSLGLPPLPPPPGASGALAALRDEMSND
ncbi:MAG: hypothetical protein EB157_06090 [Euryarchaeota archaeon]|nr:hypothetical protein [Euryarchaeota archaeon]